MVRPVGGSVPSEGMAEVCEDCGGDHSLISTLMELVNMVRPVDEAEAEQLRRVRACIERERESDV